MIGARRRIIESSTRDSKMSESQRRKKSNWGRSRNKRGRQRGLNVDQNANNTDNLRKVQRTEGKKFI